MIVELPELSPVFVHVPHLFLRFLLVNEDQGSPENHYVVANKLRHRDDNISIGRIVLQELITA